MPLHLDQRPLPKEAVGSLLQVAGRTAEDSVVATLFVQTCCDHVANSACDGQRTDYRKHGIYKQLKAIHTLTPLIRGLPSIKASDLIPNLLCGGSAIGTGGFLPQVGSGTNVSISFPDMQIPKLVCDVFPRL